MLAQVALSYGVFSGGPRLLADGISIVCLLALIRACMHDAFTSILILVYIMNIED